MRLRVEINYFLTTFLQRDVVGVKQERVAKIFGDGDIDAAQVK